MIVNKKRILVAVMAGISLVLVLASCVGPSAIPEDTFYRLQDQAPAVVYSSPIIDKPLAVARFRVNGVYNERAILYADSQWPLQLKQYHYHHWQESPDRLVQESLLSYLQLSNVAPSVRRYDVDLRGGMIVSGTVHRFERYLTANGVKAVVSLELEYLEDGGRQPLIAKTYTEAVEVGSKRMHDTIEGFGVALSRIYGSFLGDLKEIQSP